jgi:hypothetical protein
MPTIESGIREVGGRKISILDSTVKNGKENDYIRIERQHRDIPSWLIHKTLTKLSNKGQERT